MNDKTISISPFTETEIIKAMKKLGLKQHVFICNPSENISQKDLPDGVRLVHNPWVELGKGYLMEDDPYCGLFEGGKR